MKMNFSNSLKKGFTLIELLVVVAIIGILASVVLASLTNARSKGADAAIRSAMSSVRAQAELYYENNGEDYTGICTENSINGGLADILDNAAKKLNAGNSVTNGDFVYNAGLGVGAAVCHESPTEFEAVVSLKTIPNSGLCVDNTNVIKEVLDGNLDAGDTAC